MNVVTGEIAGTGSRFQTKYYRAGIIGAPVNQFISAPHGVVGVFEFILIAADQVVRQFKFRDSVLPVDFAVDDFAHAQGIVEYLRTAGIPLYARMCQAGYAGNVCANPYILSFIYIAA